MRAQLPTYKQTLEILSKSNSSVTISKNNYKVGDSINTLPKEDLQIVIKGKNSSLTKDNNNGDQSRRPESRDQSILQPGDYKNINQL